LSVTKYKQQQQCPIGSGSESGKVGNKALHTQNHQRSNNHRHIHSIIIVVTTVETTIAPLQLPPLYCSSIFYQSNKAKIDRKGLVVIEYLSGTKKTKKDDPAIDSFLRDNNVRRNETLLRLVLREIKIPSSADPC